MAYEFFLVAMKAGGLPHPFPEFRFAPPRKWRADFCWPAQRLILEVEGGVWSRGRHVRGAGFLADMEKYNAAAVMGYRILRVTPQQLVSGKASALVRKALEWIPPSS